MSRFLAWLIDAVGWLLWKVGPWRAIALGRALGVFVFHVLPVRRRIVFENLAHAFPERTDAERRRIARGVYRQLGRTLIETLIIGRLTPAQIESLITFEGLEQIDRARDRGAGVIACLAHMGNWELLGFGGKQRGYSFVAITKVLSGELNRRIQATRRKAFDELPPKGSFERGLEVLRSNRILGLIVDQHRGGEKSVVVSFFGRAAGTSPAPALFAIRSGAPVFMVWVSLGPDDRYVVRIEGPVPVPDAPTPAERLQRHTQLVTSLLEQQIRAHPEEWFWVHRRWKINSEEPARAAALAATAP
jgi:KDO2-lipid IV(A) lauroyltransferase